LTSLAAQAGAADRAADVTAVLKELDGALAGDEASSGEIVMALLSKASAASQAQLSAAGGGRLRTILGGILTGARATAVDPSRPAGERAAAALSLRFATFEDVSALLADMLGTRQPPDVQTAAIETLARFDDIRAARVLLDAWAEMSPKLRAKAAEALFARPAWAEAFLDAVEQGSIGRADVDPARLELLKKYPAAAVQTRAVRIFTAVKPRRQDVVEIYQKSLQLKGDRQRGKAVFKEQCSSCHRLEGVGRQLGADLAAIRDRGIESVLLNVLDPNRDVMPQYQSYVLGTTTGRVVTGMIAEETANSVTIRQPNGGEEIVPRHQIEELRSTGLSFMPEGLEKQIDVPAMADLLAFISSAQSQ
jgi:putative heme-binding domain-containing protein